MTKDIIEIRLVFDILRKNLTDELYTKVCGEINKLFRVKLAADSWGIGDANR